MKWNLKLQPSSLKLTYFYSAQWQNTDTCNTNQLAITTLTNAGSTQSWRPLWATALLLKREVNLPGCPEGSQQWSGSALTSNHPRRRSRNGKKTAALTITPHPTEIPQKHPHRKTRYNHHSVLSPSTSLLSLLVPSHLEPESLACSSRRTSSKMS